MKLILKPTQSGKTKYMIDKMIEDILSEYLDNDRSREIINCIVTHNRNILTTQTAVRIKVAHPDILEISSKSNNFNQVYMEITLKKCRTITMCGNKIQILNMSKIIEFALAHNKKVRVWADEIDYYWSTFKDIIIDNYDSRIKILGLTASISNKMFLDSGGSLDFIHLDVPIGENYNRYEDNDITHVKCDEDISIIDNYKNWLNSQNFVADDNIFLPGTHKNISHEELKNDCFLRGICPITINQHGFNIYLISAITPIKIDITTDMCIEQILSDIRQKYNIDKPIAVIGYSSPGRGITIQSPNFMFTYACILVNSSNACTLYQLLGRLTHNYKNLIQNKCKIFITEKIDKIVKEMEYKAVNIHKLNTETETVTYQTYKKLKPQSEYNVTEAYDNKELCRQYLLDNRKNTIVSICCYQLNRVNNTIKYQDPNNTSRTIDTPIVKFITRDQFKTLNWGFKNIGKANSSPKARVMPVLDINNEVKWIGLYIKECFSITD